MAEKIPFRIGAIAMADPLADSDDAGPVCEIPRRFHAVRGHQDKEPLRIDENLTAMGSRQAGLERRAGGAGASGRRRNRLSIITPSAFRSRIESFGCLFVWRAGANGEAVLKPANCPEDMARALMATLEAREHLPRIATVVKCPVALELNGDLEILGPGYHSEHGGILVPDGAGRPKFQSAKPLRRSQACSTSSISRLPATAPVRWRV